MRLYPVGSAAWRRVLIPVAARWAWAICCSVIFRTREAAACRKPKRRCTRAMASLRCAPWSESFSAPPRLSPAVSRWDAKGPPCRWAAASLRCSARRLGLRPENVKALIPVGAAAAIAAAFNTPLAAVVFRARRNRGRSERAGAWFRGAGVRDLLVGSAIVSRQRSSVQSAAISTRASDRVSPLRGTGRGRRASYPWYSPRCCSECDCGSRQLPTWTRWFQPAVGGVVAGLIAWRVPQVLGVGYGYVGDALNNNMALELMALLVVFKARGRDHQLRFGQRGRHFRTQPVHRRDARRHRSEAWRIISGPHIPPLRERTRWWAWALCSREFCACR